MTEQSEHLSNAQIENYGNRTSGAGPEAAQRDEHQRVNHQSTGDQSNDQSIDDQRVEAHLTDCPSCRNRVLDFHRSLFASPTFQPEPDRSKAGQPKYDALAHDSSLYGHLPSGYAPSGHLPLGQKPLGQKPSDQRPADSSLGGAKPTDSALADSNFANSKYPAEPQVRTAPTPECPSDDALRQLAAGLTPDDAAPALAHHASTCDHCGPLLRTFTEDFSDDFTAEEQAALVNLKSSSAEWQKTTAREMLEAGGVQVAATPATDGQPSLGKSSAKAATERKPFFWKWVLVPAVAVVVVLAAITFPIYLAQRDTPEKVEVLLAQASTERRNLEMRIPYAKYSEFHQKRSGEPTPMLQLPESSRKAADAISSHLKAHPDDPEWLLLSARWYLLDWQFKPALEALEKIENKDPSRQSEIDMVRAMALYEKAAYDPNEYGRAIDLLGTVLQKNPNDPIALHNQAVACEKAQNSVCAIDDWNRLLKTEKDPDWSAEAQKHLNQLQEKKNPASTPSPK